MIQKGTFGNKNHSWQQIDDNDGVISWDYETMEKSSEHLAMTLSWYRHQLRIDTDQNEGLVKPHWALWNWENVSLLWDVNGILIN